MSSIFSAMKRLRLVWSDKGEERYWYAEERIRMVDPESGEVRTRRHWRSLGVKGAEKRRTAERVLREIQREIDVGTSTSSRASVTVRSFFEEYLAAASVSIRPRTTQMYRYWLGLFAKQYGLSRIGDVDTRLVEAWKSQLSKRYGPTSINIALRSLRAALAWGVRVGILPVNPASTVRSAHVPARTFAPYVTIEQFRDILLPSVSEPRHRVAFALAMFAGLRLMEVARLRWSQVDFARKEIRIESGDGFSTKSGRGRTVPLYEVLAAELRTVDRSSQSDKDYVLGIGGRPPDSSALTHAWLRCMRAIRRDHPEIPPISFHGLRHSYATHLAASGLNLRALQALLGHASITTTMIYTHVQQQTAVEAARAMEPETRGRDIPPLRLVKSGSD